MLAEAAVTLHTTFVLPRTLALAFLKDELSISPEAFREGSMFHGAVEPAASPTTCTTQSLEGDEPTRGDIILGAASPPGSPWPPPAAMKPPARSSTSLNLALCHAVGEVTTTLLV
mmetsp:Transcript_18711/g.54274  ORF Transcript_18711/g.54274 Transcript_18711/m.54274 type:complete len:115 (-) Transcript_18711:262-606(-)